jgi:hypothetical protein
MTLFEVGVVIGSWVVLFCVGSEHGFNKRYDKYRKQKDIELKQIFMELDQKQ